MHEKEKVEDFIVKSEIRELVEIEQADKRYPYIFVLRPNRRQLLSECQAKVKKALSDGEISQLEYKKYSKELVEQCIVSMERERVKEIIGVIEKYIARVRQST